MALIDTIIDRIWQAQNTAKQTEQDVVQKQVQRVTSWKETAKQTAGSEDPQQSAKKDAASSGQAFPPALPKVEDTRTTRQKHDDAKKAYDDYVSSDEHKQKLAEANKTALHRGTAGRR